MTNRREWPCEHIFKVSKPEECGGEEWYVQFELGVFYYPDIEWDFCPFCGAQRPASRSRKGKG